ncbi:MAG: aldo/keto reductase [Gammaproteobacteria bacterium]|nr:aldo/keto reductase [Gammaproteobacteria bacterium]
MHRTIGITDIKAFAIGLGAMPLSIAGRPDAEQGKAVILAALEAGVDFIDTADCYCIDDNDFGHNEKLITSALAGLSAAQRPTVATKGGLTRPGGRWERNGLPEHLRNACEKSLRNLGVETIVLYQLHAPDSAVPFSDSVGELARLHEQGKIANVGLSNVDKDQIDTAKDIVPISSVQNECHVLYKKDMANGLVDYCGTQGITYIPYSPVGGDGHKKLPEVHLLAEIASKHGVSVYQVALAWLLHKGDHVLPIPGASRISSIRDSAKAVELRLSPEEVARIDAIPD